MFLDPLTLIGMFVLTGLAAVTIWLRGRCRKRQDTC